MLEVRFELTRVSPEDLKTSALDQLGHPSFVLWKNLAFYLYDLTVLQRPCPLPRWKGPPGIARKTRETMFHETFINRFLFLFSIPVLMPPVLKSASGFNYSIFFLLVAEVGATNVRLAHLRISSTKMTGTEITRTAIHSSLLRGVIEKRDYRIYIKIKETRHDRLEHTVKKGT